MKILNLRLGVCGLRGRVGGLGGGGRDGRHDDRGSQRRRIGGGGGGGHVARGRGVAGARRHRVRAGGGRAGGRGAVGEEHVMEDHEPECERHDVGREVHEVDDQHVLDPVVQAHPGREVVAELGRQREDHPHHGRDHPDREGLAEHVRLALALPGPAAQHVADGRAAERGHQGGRGGGHVKQAVADREQDLTGRQRRGRDADKAGKTNAHLGAELHHETVLSEYHMLPWLGTSVTGVTQVNSTETSGLRYYPDYPRSAGSGPSARMLWSRVLYFTLPCTAGPRRPDPPTRGRWLRSVTLSSGPPPRRIQAGYKPGAGRVGTSGGGMRILVLGGDGYLGWPTALHLSSRGHQVAVADNFARRHYDDELGVESLVPIEPLRARIALWESLTGAAIGCYVGDLCDPVFTYAMIRSFRPDAIVHFAEQRAAPYSMIDRSHALYTQSNNVLGTLTLLYAMAEIDPRIHLVKLGTMGAYGTPNIDIEEGWLDLEHNGRTDRVLFPKRPGSFYHLSKVHDSHNIEFACRIWDLRATDLNQGVVYGQQTKETARDERLATRFDYDAVFGTVLNRFAIQAVIGHPLTVYGSGGQTRGMIDIRDTVRCIQLACENPANRGEFRVFNQITEWMSVKDIAETVANAFPGDVTIENVENPRVEAPEHHYNVKHTAVIELGLEPPLLSDTLIESLFDVTKQYAHRVRLEALRPTVKWRSPTAS